MYYPQQSPGLSHKLPNHHDQSPWGRSHPVLGPPGAQPSVGPPPTSPGYAIYTNGNVNAMQHHPVHHPHPLTGHPPLQLHHHQNSLSHYPSPPNGHTLQPHAIGQGSPVGANTQIISAQWQQQLLKCEVRVTYFKYNHAELPVDDPCISVTSSPCSRKRNGLADCHQIRHPYHKS
jgi:CCR4-NOT transcription complex subunit 6